LTSKQVIGAWLAALALVCGAIGAVLVVAGPDRHPFRGVKIAVIGSSLSRHAIPEWGSASASLLGDGRRHRRIGPSAVTEDGELSLFDAALADRVDVVFLEINPLIREFRVTSPKNNCDGAAEVLRTQVLKVQQQVAYSFRRLVGLDVHERDGTGEPQDLDRDQVIYQRWLEDSYPLQLHRPSCLLRLEQLVARARAERTEVILVLPPRSRVAADYMPPGQSQHLADLATQLANELHVPIFAPPSPWSNAMYLDNSHFNLRGRQRFDAELRQWWARWR
jgi:hypothetical protein